MSRCANGEMLASLTEVHTSSAVSSVVRATATSDGQHHSVGTTHVFIGVLGHCAKIFRSIVESMDRDFEGKVVYTLL